MTTGLCIVCEQPLVIHIDPDSDNGSVSFGETSDENQSYTVDDDVELEKCGCHFHWCVKHLNAYKEELICALNRQCLLDAYNITECPNCGTNLSYIAQSGHQQVLCNLRNEGGLQERLDILPLLMEESYLKAYPEERRCRAFLDFCEKGDIEAIIALLRDDEIDELQEIEEVTRSGNYGNEKGILRYQDPLGSMRSGLHGAVVNEKVEVVWLLLFLASSLELSHFPAEVLQAAEQFGLSREYQNDQKDIRSLQDSDGLTAGQHALMLGEPWSEWIQSGTLSV